MKKPKKCKHLWISNSGKGGKPVFKLNRLMSPQPLMHVHCNGCTARTWMTKRQWDAL